MSWVDAGGRLEVALVQILTQQLCLPNLSLPSSEDSELPAVPELSCTGQFVPSKHRHQFTFELPLPVLSRKFAQLPVHSLTLNKTLQLRHTSLQHSFSL